MANGECYCFCSEPRGIGEGHYPHCPKYQPPRPRPDDVATLRKQILAYQKDLAMCRRCLYYIIEQSRSRSPGPGALQHLFNIYRVSTRCLEELKQK